MKVNYSSNRKNFLKINPQDAIGLALTDITLAVQNRAKQIAPVDTGTLKRSITSDFSQISKGRTMVGSPVPYARRRHFENKKTPSSLRYLERGYTEQAGRLQGILNKALRGMFN